jgi:hypothetical protein
MIVFLSGCGSHVEPESQQEKPQKVIKKSVSLIVEVLPTWVMNPTKEGYICEVGSSSIYEKMALTKRTALIIAKANISKEIKLYIDTQITKKSHCEGDNCQKEIHSKSTLTSSNMIRNVSVIDSYHDTDTARYYIHLCTSKID